MALPLLALPPGPPPPQGAAEDIDNWLTDLIGWQSPSKSPPPASGEWSFYEKPDSVLKHRALPIMKCSFPDKDGGTVEGFVQWICDSSIEFELKANRLPRRGKKPVAKLESIDEKRNWHIFTHARREQRVEFDQAVVRAMLSDRPGVVKAVKAILDAQSPSEHEQLLGKKFDIWLERDAKRVNEGNQVKQARIILPIPKFSKNPDDGSEADLSHASVHVHGTRPEDGIVSFSVSMIYEKTEAEMFYSLPSSGDLFKALYTAIEPPFVDVVNDVLGIYWNPGFPAYAMPWAESIVKRVKEAIDKRVKEAIDETRVS